VTSGAPPAASDGNARTALDSSVCADIDACRKLGERPFWSDRSLWQDRAERERAIRALIRACDLGDRRDCNIVGGLYRNGDGVGRDLARARAYHALACNHDEEDHPEACFNVYLDDQALGSHP
jgi:TPR repeat protein